MTYEHRQRRESVDKQVAYGIVALEVLYPLLALALLTSDIDDVEEVAIELELDLLGADGEATGPQYVLVGGLVIRVGNAVEVLEIAAPDLKSRAQHPHVRHENVLLGTLNEVELGTASKGRLDAAVVLPQPLDVVGKLGGEHAIAHRVGIRELSGGGLAA